MEFLMHWKAWLIEPRTRASMNLLLTIFIGLLSSILATQIMPQGQLDWKLIYTASAFWALIVAAVALLGFQWYCIGFDEDVSKFGDAAHCIAYIRKAQLEGAASHIRKNPEQAMLMDAKELLKRMGIK